MQVKIAAALDRQHPRDLFDVKLLLENEGVSRDIMTGFLVYLMCHKRPPNELLKPTLQDQSTLFDADFKGMTNIDFDYAAFVKTREVLIESHAQELPAIKWKLKNIQKMNAVKKTEAVDLVKQVLKI